MNVVVSNLFYHSIEYYWIENRMYFFIITVMCASWSFLIYYIFSYFFSFSYYCCTYYFFLFFNLFIGWRVSARVLIIFILNIISLNKLFKKMVLCVPKSFLKQVRAIFVYRYKQLNQFLKQENTTTWHNFLYFFTNISLACFRKTLWYT